MTKRGPYTIKSSKQIYKNPWIEVREDAVVFPNGSESIWGTVHIKHGVSVLAMDDQGNIYFTKQFHYGTGNETPEVIAGGIDGDETPLQAAQRELQEEAGLEAKEWTFIGMMRPMTSYTDHVEHLYLARGLTEVSQHLDPGEIISIFKIPFATAVQWVMENKIEDCYSACLILRVAEYVKKHSNILENVRIS